MVNKFHQYQQNEQLPVTSQFKPLNTHTPYGVYYQLYNKQYDKSHTSNDYYCFSLISK